MNNNYYQSQDISNRQMHQTPSQNSFYEPSFSSDKYPLFLNILNLNRGKKAKFYVTIPGSVEWQDKIFEGIIEQSTNDYIVVSNPNTGEWYLILTIYLDFINFEEPISY